MIYGLYQSAAGMMVNEYRQDVIANNIANAETVGFKRDLSSFRERLPARDADVRQGPRHQLLDEMTGGIWLGETVTDYAEGTLRRTDQPLDVALSGPGFLQVRAENGETLLSRDGRMMPDPTGFLVSVTDGAPLVGVGGAPIRIDRRGGAVTIDQNGRVQQDGISRGQLAVHNPLNYDGLTKIGASRFRADASGTEQLVRPQLMQGFVEDSGVEPVREMTNMMEAARAYQLNAQMITLQDQSLARLLSSLSNV